MPSSPKHTRNPQIHMLIAFVLSLLIIPGTASAQDQTSQNPALGPEQQSIVAISALTARGDVQALPEALNSGLDTGLSVNEIKEVLVQLYAYSGFPRSLLGLTTFMAVLEDREARGMEIEVGETASPQLDDGSAYANGEQVLATIVPGWSPTVPQSGYVAFAPVIERFLRAHLFGDIFTGAVWVDMVVTDTETYDTRAGNVTFEPGSRTDWHSHPGGQILFVTGGSGYHQLRGEPVHLIRKGDVVKVPPGVPHWHGALPESELTHMAVVTNDSAGETVWLEPVTDKEYHRTW